MRLISEETTTATINREDVKKALRSIPKEIANSIKRNRPGREYKIPARVLGDTSSGGYLANYFQEVLYSLGLNGLQQVKYEPKKGITISPDGVRALQGVL